MSKLGYFDIEINDSTRWISLNDHHRFIGGAATLGESNYTMRNTTADASLYDGSWVVHSTAENVIEVVEVKVIGGNASEVEENVADLITWFKQAHYLVRISIGNHVETWRCFPADYVRMRGHVYAHNLVQFVRFSVPHLPGVTQEVRS